MESRPLINLSNKELLSYFQSNSEELNTLAEIVYEIHFRSRIDSSKKEVVLNQFIRLMRGSSGEDTDNFSKKANEHQIWEQKRLTNKYDISSSEFKIIQLLRKGYSTTEMAKTLMLSEGTIRNYRSSLYKKLNVENCVEAIYKAYQIGLIEPPKDDEITDPVLREINSRAGVKLYFDLKDRELEVLYAGLKGKTNQEIADGLEIGYGTVRNNFTSLYEKLDVSNRVEAVEKAIRVGLIDI